MACQARAAWYSEIATTLNETLFTGRQTVQDARLLPHRRPRNELCSATLGLDDAAAKFGRPRLARQLRARRLTRLLKCVGEGETLRLRKC